MKYLATGLVSVAVILGLALPAQAMDTNWPCKGCISTHR
jgi:hypothetical protein